jgi:pimeloyl-ACP methyl ester carboxylesterase
VLAQIAKTAEHSPERLLGQIGRGLCKADKDVLAVVGTDVIENLREAFKQGTYAAVYELSLLARPWDFLLPDIDMEVQLWHGVHDHSAPVTMAHNMTLLLPHDRTQIFRTEGHYSVLVNHADEILATLIQSQPARAAA